LGKLEKNEKYQIPSLISPRAYVSPAAKVMAGCIIEPMAVVHREATLGKGCIISAGAVVNHESTCGDCVHIDCNATVASYARVPEKTKVCSGEVYKRENETTEKKESVNL
jgi:UDP-3-O-[3-hydroxymyristoyl] glucosamine N-acyltransferase